ncbi:hypothetical protein HI914_00480 [Erysiphe necator]|nr:hypothetical protein HI914_00480 [Erysiphe necator]
MSFKLLSIACLLLSVAHAAPHGSTSGTLPSGQNIYSPGVKYTHNQDEQLSRRSSEDDYLNKKFGRVAADQEQTLRYREKFSKERGQHDGKRGYGSIREPPTRYEKAKQKAIS